MQIRDDSRVTPESTSWQLLFHCMREADTAWRVGDNSLTEAIFLGPTKTPILEKANPPITISICLRTFNFT